MALWSGLKLVLSPQRQAQNQWGRGSSSQSSRASAVKRLMIQASCSPLAMALSPATLPSSSCLMKTAGLSSSGSGIVSRGSLPALSSYPSGHSSGSPSIFWICCLSAQHLALMSARCLWRWLALLLYMVSLCYIVVVRPATSAHNWVGARFLCPARMPWTVQGERGLSQKALVSRLWRGLGMVIWLEGVGLVCEAESTSWLVMMTDSCLRWLGSWTGSGVGEKAIEKL